MTELRTPRLVLRRARPGDVDGLHAILSDKRAMKHWSTLPHESLAETQQWLDAMLARGPGFELQRKRLLRGGLHGLRIGTFRSGDEREPETGQLPDMMSFYEDIAIHTDFSFQHRILSQALHEHRCPAINKAFRQPFM